MTIRQNNISSINNKNVHPSLINIIDYSNVDFAEGNKQIVWVSSNPVAMNRFIPNHAHQSSYPNQMQQIQQVPYPTQPQQVNMSMPSNSNSTRPMYYARNGGNNSNNLVSSQQ